MAAARAGAGANESGTGTGTLDECIPFADFADLLEKVSNASTAAQKQSKLTAFVKQFRTKFAELHKTLQSNDASNNDSIFSIIRLLYPAGDRKRASYNFKTVALSRMLAKILGLDKSSADGRKLLEYKDPLKSAPVGASIGDLGVIVGSIMESRFSHQSSAKGVTVSDLHGVLDRLARGRGGSSGKDSAAVTQDQQVKILQGFIRKLTPLEGKWLVRILLKDLMLGVSKQQIFKLIHPKAAELMNTMDLEGACKRCNDPSSPLLDADGANSSAGVNLFTFFRPMLCTRLDQIDDASKVNRLDDDDDDDDEDLASKGKRAKRKAKANEPVKLPDPPFILETKWDGERFQIHYELGPGGDGVHKFKFYSRNGHDYSSTFTQTLSPRLVAQFVEDPPVRSFILDGEMMAWNKQTRAFTQKGGNVDVKTLTTDSPHCPLFVAFDILYYNGESICNKPLRERVDFLTQLLVPEESTCQFSEQTMVQDKASVTDALNEAIDKLEEGLVVKTVDSVYQPGKRGAEWLKIKPEYIEGHAVEDLDLLILGAYYSDSTQKSRGQITNFLVGLVGDTKKDFYPLATVGFGKLNYGQRQELLSNLREVLVNHEFPSVKHGRRRKPDLHIDPRKSVVLQVKASEIISSREYEVGYSLRFPRITRTRYDKRWDDAMSVKEFRDLQRACDGKLAKKSGASAGGRGPPWLRDKSKPASAAGRGNGDSADSSDENEGAVGSINKSPTKRNTHTKVPQAPAKSALSILAASTSGPAKTNTSSIFSSTKKSSAFAGRIFCVIGADEWKTEVSNALKSHGAKEIIPNPMLDCMCIVAEKESLRIKNYEKNGTFDIAKGRIWIDKCLAAGKLLGFQPEDLYYANDETRASFKHAYDEYGDSYTKPSTLAEVKELVQKIIAEEPEPAPNQNPKSQKALRALKRELSHELARFSSPKKGSYPKSKLSKWSFMNGCKIWVVGQLPAPAHLSTLTSFEFYGGQVASEESEQGITHVVVGSGDTPPPRQKSKSASTSSAIVVNSEWLMDSLASREMVPETKYLI